MNDFAVENEGSLFYTRTRSTCRRKTLGLYVDGLLSGIILIYTHLKCQATVLPSANRLLHISCCRGLISYGAHIRVLRRRG